MRFLLASPVQAFRVLNNMLGQVKPKGIALRRWTKASFENDTLRDLDNEAIYVPNPIETANNKPSYFHFLGNILNGLEKHSLHLKNESKTETVMRDNIFIKSCDCDWSSFVNNFVRAMSIVVGPRPPSSILCTMTVPATSIRILRSVFRIPKDLYKRSTSPSTSANRAKPQHVTRPLNRIRRPPIPTFPRRWTS